MSLSPTAIVIGTGVAGASTGFALARRGVDVTLIESGFEAPATAAGAGIIQPWSSAVDGEYYRYYAEGADFYDELIPRLAEVGVDDIGYRQSGALVVNRDSSLLDEVEDRVHSRIGDARLAGEVSRVSESRAKELFPPLGAGFKGLHISGGARVDGRVLRQGLLNAVERLGGRIIAGEATLEPTPEGNWVAMLGGRRFEADSIVIAAGAWTNRLLERLGKRVSIEPQRGQITHLRVETADTRLWPSVHPMSGHYMLAFDDSRVVVGATREPGTGFDPRVTAAGQREVLENALAVAPGLADATLIETRVGLRPMPEGTLPVVGAIDGMAGVYINAGFGAGGLTMGPIVGDRLAAIILGETDAPSEGILSPVRL
ncbi:NAD(P)/FAD-dependent oxidoreductase [Microbacterium esteraromaticum]|uniref:NAD(P)/FAD-dependent oxidoreductase n=1 Tax=Microbacterium esteraromaticum TaxID=57043 RepID=UPI00195ECF0C|nr:FAD-dependent oxidoreductase [Microbacterium esteraromaticum]MBM7466605.1 D-amino-acid dehydrogenase [Microbacterium esteraromaticum]